MTYEETTIFIVDCIIAVIVGWALGVYLVPAIVF